MYGNGGCGCGGRRHGQWSGPGYGWGSDPGYGQGLSPSGMPRGTGWVIRAALGEGAKTESEIKDYINKYSGYQITYSLKPVLDFWVSRGLAKLKEDDKYELTFQAPGPMWY